MLILAYVVFVDQGKDVIWDMVSEEYTLLFVGPWEDQQFLAIYNRQQY
jgi:hypothetical protein